MVKGQCALLLVPVVYLHIPRSYLLWMSTLTMGAPAARLHAARRVKVIKGSLVEADGRGVGRLRHGPAEDQVLSVRHLPARIRKEVRARASGRVRVQGLHQVLRSVCQLPAPPVGRELCDGVRHEGGRGQPPGERLAHGVEGAEGVGEWPFKATLEHA